MPALHLFNPGHETAVLLGTANYTPSANVKKMTEDLALLPLWYACQDDLIYDGTGTGNSFIRSLPVGLGPFASSLIPDVIGSKAYTAKPWGISPQALNLCQRIKKHSLPNLFIPEWKEEYKVLTGRQTSISCHKLLYERLEGLAVPHPPVMLHSVEQLQEYLAEAPLPVVTKAPYSSSGRGVLWLRNKTLTNAERNWIKGIIQKQGFISIEKGLDKTRDFAMEFYSDGEGTVTYEGLSIFTTGEKGAYSGNKLASQDSLHKEIASITGQDAFARVRAAVEQVLTRIYAHNYEGYLGVDMMLYRDNDRIRIHPCVEVNMRTTMGVVALRIFDRYVHPEAKGVYSVVFDKEPGIALERHRELTANHPLRIDEGKIVRGYLALCPVTGQTNYRAYLVIS